MCCWCALRPYIKELKRKLTKGDQEKLRSTGGGVTRKYMNAAGQTRVCGAKRLKDTQVYTRGFALAVLAAHRRYTFKDHLKACQVRRLRSARPMRNDTGMDERLDANLGSIHHLVLRRAHKHGGTQDGAPTAAL